MAVEVGQRAPDFVLTDQNKNQVELSDFQGKKNVVIVFHPLAFTSICEGEICQLRDNYESFKQSDTEVLAISVDSSAVHKAWADQLGSEIPYLSDFWPHGEVAKAYGVFDEEKGIAKRGTFFIDKDGVVTDIEINEVPEARDIAGYSSRLQVTA